MKAIIQRVSKASVTVEEKIIGEIGKGFLILLGVESDDTAKDADILASKIVQMRIFTDSNDKMNLSLFDIDGEILVVSNFTLCADCKKGRRPSFINAAAPTEAERLYEYFCAELKQNDIKKVERGAFGADMAVSLINDGPVTIILDSKDLGNL
ncbi:MAG: D-aminoacyl-tRNA deacylase [Bacillota bacterium]|nr:D-aminoacyl-tRNA deacylase [Bacillota bacterium]